MSWILALKSALVGKTIIDIKEDELSDVIFVVKEDDGSTKDVNLGTYSIYSAEDLLIPSGWDCKNSPTGKCDYEQEDGEYDEDHCRFCGRPEERK